MRAWHLCKKDLRVYLRDPVGVLLGIGLPVVLAFVFGAAMGGMAGGEQSMGRVRLFVEDRDGTDASRELVATLGEADGLRISAVDVTDPEAETAEERVADGDGPAGLLIPAGFAAALAAGESPGLVLYRDPGKQIEQQIVAGNLMQALFASLGETIGKRMSARVLDLVDFPDAAREQALRILDGSWEGMSALIERLEDEGAFTADESAQDGEAEDDEGGFDFASALVDVLGLETRDVVGQQHDDVQRAAAQAHAISGIAVMMLLFGLVACGGTILQEEVEGTLDRLRLAPGDPGDVLKGKFLFTWLIGVTQLVILFCAVRLVFPIPVFERPLALVVLSMVVAAAATGFGILFAALCRTRAQLEGISTIVILTMSAMGGAWWPLTITPEWYQKLAHFTLTAWAMDGYQAIFWFDRGLGGIGLELGVLLGIAAATSAAAWMLWKRRLRVA